MTTKFQVESMTTAEKLAAVEEIWGNLCTSPATVPVPEWHKELLKQREERLVSGNAEVSTWTEAKKRLENLGR